MGLIYLFPVDKDQLDERISETNQTLTLKTYGLPMIFWGYLAAILGVVAVMWLAGNSIIEKMLSYNDFSLTFLAYLVRGTLILGPIVLLGFYFYEKFLTKKNNELVITHRLFFIPIVKKKIILKSNDSFEVNHFLDSPNVAKMRNQSDLKGFENKGYFELFAVTDNKKEFVDRSSRKADLVKLKDLLSKY